MIRWLDEFVASDYGSVDRWVHRWVGLRVGAWVCCVSVSVDGFIGWVGQYVDMLVIHIPGHSQFPKATGKELRTYCGEVVNWSLQLFKTSTLGNYKWMLQERRELQSLSNWWNWFYVPLQLIYGYVETYDDIDVEVDRKPCPPFQGQVFLHHIDMVWDGHAFDYPVCPHQVKELQSWSRNS